MYKKAWINGEFLYFVHAPPQTQTDLDNKSNPRLPKPAHRNARPEFSSVYYYWWAFLRLNQSYIEYCTNGGEGPLGGLYRDFGDVRDADFIEWWPKHGPYCFSEPQQTEFVTVLGALPKTHDFEQSALITVPLVADIEETLKRLREELKPQFDQHRAKYGHFSKARYQVADKPVLGSLHKILLVKEAQIAHPNLPKHELAKVAELYIENKNARDGRDPVQLNSNRVHLWLEKADQLIANVVKGRFPDFSNPNKPKLAKKPIDFGNI